MKYYLRLKRFLIFLYYRIVRLRGTPEYIARGFALGVFIGMTPTMGFQMAIAAFIATLLKQNIIATALSVWVTNAFTFIPIYTFNYAVGRWVLSKPITGQLKVGTFSSMKALFSMGWEFFYTLWFGSMVVGVVTSIITYYISIPLIKKYQEKRRLRRKKKREKKLKKILKIKL
jgi:uncharacterized protein (TIGR03546 family)